VEGGGYGLVGGAGSGGDVILRCGDGRGPRTRRRRVESRAQNRR
jgi:hypothetical protein